MIPIESSLIAILLTEKGEDRLGGQGDQKQLQVQVEKVDKEQQSVHDCSFQIC